MLILSFKELGLSVRAGIWALSPHRVLLSLNGALSAARHSVSFHIDQITHCTKTWFYFQSMEDIQYWHDHLMDSRILLWYRTVLLDNMNIITIVINFSWWSVIYYHLSHLNFIQLLLQWRQRQSQVTGGSGVCRTSNYPNPIRKFAKFLFPKPMKWKTQSPAKMLIECNLGRNK